MKRILPTGGKIWSRLPSEYMPERLREYCLKIIQLTGCQRSHQDSNKIVGRIRILERRGDTLYVRVVNSAPLAKNEIENCQDIFWDQFFQTKRRMKAQRTVEGTGAALWTLDKPQWSYERPWRSPWTNCWWTSPAHASGQRKSLICNSRCQVTSYNK